MAPAGTAASGEEGLRVEGVGLDLLLLETEIGLEPLEVGGHPFLGDEQRQLSQVFQLLGHARMRDQNLRILLEDGRDRHHRHVVCDRIERHQRVRAHEEIKLAGNQQHAIVVVWAARHDGDVQPVTLVGAVGQGLEKSAVLSLGDPVGSERDLIRRGLGAGRRDGHENGHKTGN